MKPWSKRFFSLMLTAALLLSWLPSVQVQAAEPELLTEETVAIQAAPDVELPENAELFAGFVEQQLYGYDFSTFGTAARAGLNPIEQQIYDALKVQIETVALNGGSTKFTIPEISGLKTFWTKEELGVSTITVDAVGAALYAQFSVDALLNAVLSDCPFDLYWFDKTVPNALFVPCSIYNYGDSAEAKNITFEFAVAQDYRAGSNVVTSNVAKINTVKYNAAQVVAVNAGKSDVEKMKAYKEYICGEVTYNHTAADTPGYPYGDPWQLIYVFDDDISTNVVCEGYSKAFQYLCELSDLECISVTGTMDGVGHMWNIVTLDGKNYLADLTNCDDGTAGEPDLLFLVGAPYKNGGYSFNCNGMDVFFQCANQNLETTNYTESPLPPVEDVLASGTCGENLTWVLTRDGTLTISGTGAMYDYPYSTNAQWYSYRANIQSVVIQAGATSVGNSAFRGCARLESVALPESLTRIGYDAFAGCSRLTELTIPGKVTAIEGNTFGNCTALTSVTIPKSVTVIDSSAFENCTALTTVAIPGKVTAIGSNAFSGCTALTSVTLPESLITIEAFAFNHCSSLVNINLPDSLTTIGQGAFDNCFGLKKITVPENVLEMGDYAFRSCTGLTSITLPESVLSFGTHVFWNCSSLTSVILPEGVAEIHDQEFYNCASLKSVVLPQGITSIGARAFEYCHSLQSLEIPQGVTSIGNSAFNFCVGLTELTLPDSLVSIGTYAFQDCSHLSTLAIPEGVSALKDGMFFNCTGLETLILPGNVAAVGNSAFYNCTALKAVFYLGTPEQKDGILLGNENTYLTAATWHMPLKEETYDGAPSYFCGHCKEHFSTNGVKLAHKEEIIPGKPATCTETGLTDGRKCTVCGTVTVPQEIIATKAHTAVTDPAVPPTENTPGKTEGSHCSVCGVVLKAQEEIPVGGHTHTAIVDAAVAPTCTETGLTEGSHCSVCGEVLVKQEKIPAAGHSYKDNVDGTCNVCSVNRETVELRKVHHMLRMYNPNTGEHFYTGSEEEKDNLVVAGWHYEGVAFTFPKNTGAPVHRLFQPSTGEHLYTMDEEEKATLMADGWNYEGIAFNSAYDTEAVQHRLHNPNATVGAYHFTFSEEEVNNLIAAGWEYQGIGWYSCWK